MIWFLSLIAISFLMGIVVLFSLDLPDREDGGGGVRQLQPPPIMAGIYDSLAARPMIASSHTLSLDDF